MNYLCIIKRITLIFVLALLATADTADACAFRPYIRTAFASGAIPRCGDIYQRMGQTGIGGREAEYVALSRFASEG